MLSPFAAVYGGAVRFRNALFDAGVFKSKGFDVPVISVGNLSAGGTGKTPVVAHFVSHLKTRGKSVAIVSRGYGGGYTARAERVDVARGPAVFGDEPVWFAKNLDVPVYVGRRRSDAVELCLKDGSPDVIVADDGFQHRWLARAKDIVLLDATEPSPRMLPAGRFREPLSSLKRADFVLLTKGNLAGAQKTRYWLDQLEAAGFSASRGNLFSVDYGLSEIRPVSGNPLKSGETVVLASGIARPESFELLIRMSHEVRSHVIRADHHPWAQADVESLRRSVAGLPVVITEKDFVKMSALDTSSLRLYIAVLDIHFNPPFPYEKLLD